MKRKLSPILLTLAAGCFLWVASVATAQVTTVPSTFVLPASAGNTAKPGFIWRVHQVASSQPNAISRLEAQLAGTLGVNIADPNSPGNAIDVAQPPNPATAPISFEIATVINLDQESGSNGNFQPDEQMPGIPGLESGTDNIAAEILTWIELPAGDVTMGVNSDDGFQLRIGASDPRDQFNGVVVGQFDGGRGASDSIFTFKIERAGLYAARLTWMEGGGGANIEWFTVQADSTKVLVNDTASSGIRAFRAVTGPTPAFVSSATPAPGSPSVLPDSPIVVEIQDAAGAVQPNSIGIELDGVKVAADVQTSGQTKTVRFVPASPFPSLSTHDVVLSFNDGSPRTIGWQFTVAKYGTLTPSMKVTPDTSKPGFIWRVSQVGTGQPNTNDRTDAQLAGLLQDADGNLLPNLANPAEQGVARAAATAPNPAHLPITFEIETVINMNQDLGGEAGNFIPDGQMPGIPGLEGGNDSIAGELITYLELPAGLITMGVNSDDGFETTAGAINDLFNAVPIGEFNGGRGAADSIFSVLVQEAGVYPFRTTWEEGGGGANIEWFTVNGGKKVLINDRANGGVSAYRATTSTVNPGIQVTVPAPGTDAMNRPQRSLNIVLADGTNPVDEKTVTLMVDGKAVSPQVVREGNRVRVTYTPAGLQIPGVIHQASISFKDSTGAFTGNQQWQFRNLKNVVLPATPVAIENFNSTQEGGVPSGWTAVNFTSTHEEGEDLDNLRSDSYKGWIAVDRDRLETLKGRIFAGVAAGETLNGQPIPQLGEGNVLYAESDVRRADQVLFITTKSFDLSKVSKAVLAFQSLYEQNQDNIAALEYTVDDGKSWHPILYYLDDAGTADVKRGADGKIDAVRTLLDPNPDTASWTDPATGETKGDTYGAFILAPITQALAPFIEPRLNDDRVEGKRLEVFRLPKADGQANVKFRFAFGGTASWYWGVDDFAIYDVPGFEEPAPVADASIAISRSATGVTISYSGGTLESADAITGPWTAVANASSPAAIQVTGTLKFYRVRQ